MSQMMMYIVPLILGRTFDLNKMQVGVDIFPKEEISKPSVIENPIAETSYKIIDSAQEAKDLLDVSGAFSLNVKGGMFKAGASGAYLRDIFNRENTVEVVIKAKYQTVTHSLPPKAQPINTWKQMQEIGSHYVRSITYGGELIASLRLICNSTRDKQRIKAALEVGGRIEIFDLGVEVEGEYLSDVSKDVDTMQIKVFSSIPLEKVPKDMKSLEAMLEDFPNTLKKYNEGRGVPVKVELWPLGYLDSTRPKFIKNKILEGYLDSFEDKFDDLLNTKAAINDWMKVMTEVLPEEQEKEIGEFYGTILATLRPFYDVIGNLDMSLGIEQLKPALDKYGTKLPGSYYRQYQQLRQKMLDDQGEWMLEKGSGVTYIHWGQSNCSELAETVYSGYTAGAGGYGGGFNFLCLIKKITDDEIKEERNRFPLQSISYKLLNGKTAQLACATCNLAATGSLQTFVGLDQCPSDWTYIYRGLLMSGLGKKKDTDFVCLDTNVNDDISETKDDSPLITNWASIISLSELSEKLVPCIVCAK